ncbi:DAD4 [Candida theae]|uniref:DASH complex subunit DAD4 n=1 Tax=Candida theae TaxID=1198502 RepID=A0AAD5BBJ4_9ASCO|nr:DAD4 [Candida theae]KAI5952094.1 DAD4 [Candida theae]
MENPHEQTHNMLLARIITNMENLNESVVEMKKLLGDANKNNLSTEVLARMWESYIRNAEYHLQATGQRETALAEEEEEEEEEEMEERE